MAKANDMIDRQYPSIHKSRPMLNQPFHHIQTLLDTHPILVFMKGTPEQPFCGFSRLVVRIFQELNVPFFGIDILEDIVLRQDLKIFSEWPTFPQVYIKGEFIGGADITREMYESGELMRLIESFSLNHIKS